jgi:hypothetical protein
MGSHVCGWVGVAGFLWLLYEGQWKSVLMGLLLALIAPVAIGVAIGLLVAPFAFLAYYFLNRGWVVVAVPFLAGASLVSAVLISIWCVFCLIYFESLSQGSAVFAHSMWANFVAMEPLVLLYMREGQQGRGEGEAIFTASALWAYAAMW